MTLSAKRYPEFEQESKEDKQISLDLKWVLLHGIVGGAISGMIFALVEMANGYLQRGDALGPLRFIAAIPLNQAPTEIAGLAELAAGFGFHLFYSIILGIVAALIVANYSKAHKSLGRIILATTFFGLLVWILDFYILAPLVNAPWFVARTNPLNQSLIHALAFGSILGLYFALELKDELETDL